MFVYLHIILIASRLTYGEDIDPFCQGCLEECMVGEAGVAECFEFCGDDGPVADCLVIQEKEEPDSGLEIDCGYCAAGGWWCNDCLSECTPITSDGLDSFVAYVRYVEGDVACSVGFGDCGFDDDDSGDDDDDDDDSNDNMFAAAKSVGNSYTSDGSHAFKYSNKPFNMSDPDVQNALKEYLENKKHVNDNTQNMVISLNQEAWINVWLIVIFMMVVFGLGCYFYHCRGKPQMTVDY